MVRRSNASLGVSIGAIAPIRTPRAGSAIPTEAEFQASWEYQRASVSAPDGPAWDHGTLAFTLGSCW